MRKLSMLHAAVLPAVFMAACDGEVGERDADADVGEEGDTDAVEDVQGEADPSDILPDRDAQEEAGSDVPEEVELPPGLAWVSIPPGSFDMGCSAGDTNCTSEELPSHGVTVPAFKMTETEITQEQYELVTGESPSHFTSCGGSCPVEQVTWDEAKAFCKSIGGRLPSEAEWEYAARAGTTTRYCCGDDEACLRTIAWYYTNAGETTHAVGEKTANDFGLYDMLGNVWEWVEDSWHEDYTDAPTDGGVWPGGDYDYRAVRGGSLYLEAPTLRVSIRREFPPGQGDRSHGFRCAK